MHWPRAVVTALALAALPAAAQAEQQERELRTLVNAERAGHGLTELRHSPVLARSAQAHARRLLRRGVLAHATSRAAPPRFRALGENLALVGGSSAQPVQALQLWLGSPEHRGVMLHSRMRRIGVGRASGLFGGTPATVWVLRVGRR